MVSEQTRLSKNNVILYNQLVSPCLTLLFIGITLLFWKDTVVLQTAHWFGFDKSTTINFLFSLLYLTLAWLINTLLNIFLWHHIAIKYGLDKVPKVLKTGISVFLYLSVFIFIVSNVYNKPINTLLAATGAMGLLVGIALQSSLQSVFNSIFLNIEKNLKIGDIIFLYGNVENEVEVLDFTWRSTILKDGLGNILVIPNNLISSIPFKRCSSFRKRYCFSLFINISFSVLSHEKSKRLLEVALKSNPDILSDPPVDILINDVTDKAIKYELRYWIIPTRSSPAKVKHDLYTAINHYLSIYSLEPKTDATPSIKTALHHVSLFSNFSDEELDFLVEQIKSHTYAKDEKIIQAGEAGSSMYIIAEGLLAVSIKSTAKDSDIFVTKLTPGMFFGELSLFTGEPRSATIITLTEAVVYEITKEVMLSLVAKNPKITSIISEKMAEIHVMNTQKQQEFSNQELKNTKNKFAALLFEKIKKWFGDVKE